MSAQEPLELEVDSDEPAVESESVVVNGASQRRPLLALVVVALLGLIGWQLFVGNTGSTGSTGSTEGSAVDENAVEPNPAEIDAGADADLDQPNVGDAEIGSTLPDFDNADDSDSDEGSDGLSDSTIEGEIGGSLSGNSDETAVPAFPLFPERPGLTLAIASPNGEVMFVDADDGTLEVMPSSASGRPGSDFSQELPSFGRVGDTLVTHDRTGVFGYPLDGSGRIDFGDADEVLWSNDLVIAARYPQAPGEVAELRAFQPDGRGESSWIPLPEQSLWPGSAGLIRGSGGTYAFTGAGFERISSHEVIAEGQNHRVEQRCDASLDCGHHRVEVSTGSAGPVDLDMDGWWNAGSVSPNGVWVAGIRWPDDGVGGPMQVLHNLDSGEQIELLGQSLENFRNTPPTVQWDATSRYAAGSANGGRTLIVFDAESQTSREISRDQLRLSFVFGAVVVLSPDDL